MNKIIPIIGIIVIILVIMAHWNANSKDIPIVDISGKTVKYVDDGWVTTTIYFTDNTYMHIYANKGMLISTGKSDEN